MFRQMKHLYYKKINKLRKTVRTENWRVIESTITRYRKSHIGKKGKYKN